MEPILGHRTRCKGMVILRDFHETLCIVLFGFVISWPLKAVVEQHLAGGNNFVDIIKFT